MADKQISGKVSAKLYFGLIIGVGLVVFVAAMSWEHYLTSNGENPVITTVFTLLIPLMVAYFLKFNVFYIHGEELVVKSILGNVKKRIALSSIERYGEVEKENDGGSWKVLTLMTKDTKVTLTSSVVSNYDELKRVLIKGAKRDKQAQEIHDYQVTRKWGWGMLVVTIGVFCLAGSKFMSRNEKITKEDLTTISGIISNRPLIQKEETTYWVDIKLQEYPSVVFEFINGNYRALSAESYMQGVKIGDKLTLSVFWEELEMIEDRKGLTGLEEIYVLPYGCVGREAYFSLDEFNNNHYQDSSGGMLWFLGIIGVVLLGVSVYILKMPKPDW